ncbi:hypothetical protein J14TS2_28400 [Bacillus sp. J14TS2]|uniref:hypothetical protein n=1 Tax=Bacillus sp. J14TS2 TaxID=2807188 RepID=UPI001B1E7292|nr:hypothetical protein [Bacillus sp. J14TS2]GIN72365.1 hypothetical protein J14TS2_28400 [Bacillus sp. J14TS2]
MFVCKDNGERLLVEMENWDIIKKSKLFIPLIIVFKDGTVKGNHAGVLDKGELYLYYL